MWLLINMYIHEGIAVNYFLNEHVCGKIIDSMYLPNYVKLSETEDITFRVCIHEFIIYDDKTCMNTIQISMCLFM